ncbi:MAG: hypothetical protein AAB225_10200 [Acidobacteriota bacterium]|mgnify:CR=1 FL=1
MGPRGGLWKIPSAGGTRQRVTEPDEANAEDSHRWPQILPGGEAALFTAGVASNIEETGAVVVQSLKDKRRKVLWRGGYYGRYLPSGHLVYVQRGTLFTVRFDPATWELMGPPAPVVEEVASAPGFGSAQFDFSRTGSLIYASGKAAGATKSLMWLDSAGKLDPLPAKPGNYLAPRLSPDGKRLAFAEFTEETRWDIWTLPLAGDNPDDPRPGKPEPFLRTRFTEWAPAFSPDGRWLAYTSTESGSFEVYVQPFPEGGAKRLVYSGGGGATAWSRTRPELFYLRPDNRIMAVTYSVKGDAFIPETWRVWSEKRLAPVPAWWDFDLAPDGNRVLALMLPPGTEEEKPQTRLTFLLNFFDELRRRVPAGGK